MFHSLLLLSLLSFASAANYAVLVAGSKGFWNYRHQADTCHAYVSLVAKGFNPQNIIVFSYDDIANHSQNPFKGEIFNKPTYDQPGKDVYSGCKIDYKGGNVTSANFLKVLKGDAAGMEGIGSGKVLTSTKDDRVFLNFVDHGAVGLIAFPSDYLYASDLLSALEYMHTHDMYSELVFYLEACESGSVFQKLPQNTKIWASSAASPDESSWGTYCAPDDKVNNVSIGSCLGDLYSVNWMEDTDSANVCQETLQEQFDVVKNKTNKSRVMEWGDLSFKNESVGDFTSTCVVNDTAGFLNKKEKSEVRRYKSVNSRDVKLFYLQNKYAKNPTDENLVELQKEEMSRKYFDAKMSHLAETNGFGFLYAKNEVYNAPGLLNFDCLKAAIEKFEKHCGKLSDYALKHVRTLAHMCSYQNDADNDKMIQSIENVVCPETQIFSEDIELFIERKIK